MLANGDASLGVLSLMRTLACLVFLPALAFGQFEAADIHNSAPTRNEFMRGPNTRASRYEIRQATMADLISVAYGINAPEVLGGPNWLEWDRFDVIAKMPANSTADDAKPMLQALLAERFKLAVHREMKPMPAMALTVAKRAQLKESEASDGGGCKFTAPPPPPPRGSDGGPPPALPTFSFACKGMSMAKFAEEVRDMVDTDDKPVIDRTGLKGTFEFSFKFNPPLRPGFTGESISAQDALDKQVGLKLEPVTVPVSVVLVDSVNRRPTENLPNILEVLHIAPDPTEFEVAEIKPTDPEFTGRRLQIQPGGRVNVAGVTLKFLVQQAWNLTDDMIIGAPKWMDQDRYNIVAKATTAGGAQLDIEQMWVLLRALINQRFKMESHMEERPVNAYTLSAGKPKMQKADPESRMKYKEGPGADGKDPRNKNSILSRLVTVQNMTMEDFAAKLQSIAPGYIHSPVLDATGLQGSWNFTLSFSPAGAAQAPGGGGRGDGPAAPSNNPGEATDPSGAVTLPEAIDKQLGLKLQLQKRPVKVLVIDRVEQKPTEN
jgi:uncharacterized protein (TIGR03435 family)